MNIVLTPQPINNPIHDNSQLIQTDVKMQETVKDYTAAGVREKDIFSLQECVTCKERRYQDRSSDGGVSMQSPTHLSPEEAGYAVRAHENEHAFREAAKAEEEGRDVVSNTIRIFTSCCPECGKTYVSGGETRTVTVSKCDENQSMDFSV